MDQNGDSTIQTTNETQSHYQFIKKILQFLVPLSLLSLSICHIIGVSFFFTYINFRFSTLIFPLFAHALDRKFMFLICNGILAFLAKNSSLFLQIPELPKMKEAVVEENEASMKSSTLENVAVAEEEKQQEIGSFEKETEERNNGAWIAESEAEDDDAVEDGTTLDGDSLVEDVNYASVNTDELNKKFEEFIKKMKEEIRIEAQQQLFVECN
ncbi:hypothetical protein Fot_39381 [Forsythia ovata]|uniref:DUF4408 domain-containing protein n=1 Tax=Forsythia ovata TaxID=205694 RepID=A0ABD1S8A8_9LAMI